jgi:AraC family transcriptional regulator
MTNEKLKYQRRQVSQENELPKVREYIKTAEGFALELHWEPTGVVELPETDEALIYTHAGAAAKLSCRRNGRRYSGTFVHGDIDITPARVPARWEIHDRNDNGLILSLPQALLSAVAAQSGLDPARVEIRDQFQIRDPELEALSWAMQRELELGSPSGRLYMDGLTLAVASRLVTRHSSITKHSADRHEGLDGRRLKRVLSFIEDQLTEDLSLEKIAAVAGISASHLNTLFRASMGMPVHQYVIRRRVERAKTLLTQDGLSMAEIAMAAGFAHQSHMARHMRRVLGLAPQEMKRLLTESSAPR